MRSDKFSFQDKQLEFYSDISISFEKNPLTGMVARVTNEEAIKQSYRNLILTTFHERPYQPFIGSKVKASLFEPIDPSSEYIIRQTLDATLKLEPRGKVLQVNVVPDYDNYAYRISVSFSCLNLPNQVFSVNLTLGILR